MAYAPNGPFATPDPPYLWRTRFDHRPFPSMNASSPSSSSMPSPPTPCGRACDGGANFAEKGRIGLRGAPFGEGGGRGNLRESSSANDAEKGSIRSKSGTKVVNISIKPLFNPEKKQDSLVTICAPLLSRFISVLIPTLPTPFPTPPPILVSIGLLVTFPFSSTSLPSTPFPFDLVKPIVKIPLAASSESTAEFGLVIMSKNESVRPSVGNCTLGILIGNVNGIGGKGCRRGLALGFGGLHADGDADVDAVVDADAPFEPEFGVVCKNGCIGIRGITRLSRVSLAP